MLLFLIKNDDDVLETISSFFLLSNRGGIYMKKSLRNIICGCSMTSVVLGVTAANKSAPGTS